MEIRGGDGEKREGKAERGGRDGESKWEGEVEGEWEMERDGRHGGGGVGN